MPATVQHVLTATTPDNTAYEIRPSHWNSAHAISLSLAGSEVSPVFSNANSISFGLSGTAVTASLAAFLTTAMLSNASSAFAGVGETTTTQAGTALGLTVDTAGVAIAYPNWLTTAQPPGAYLTTARASNDAVGLNTAATNVTWTVNSSGISVNAAAYLTTAMASNRGSDFVQATAAFAGTNASGTIASNGISVSVGPYITTARASNDAVGLNTAQSNVTWTVNSNGISLNAAGYAGTGTSATNASVTLNSNGIAISVAPPGAGGGAALKGSGTYTQNTGTIEFANSNGITFGLSNNGTMTAAHNGLTTARASNDGVGLNTALTAGPLAWTVNSGGISLNAGSAAGTSTGFTGGASISGSMTHNTAGLAVSLSHPAWLTTAALSNHSHGNPQLNLTNLSGTTASNSAGFTLSLSAAAPGAGGGAAISAGANSQNTGTVNFANSNRVTFGLSNNGTMTASIDAAGTGTTFAGANLSGSMTLNSAGLNLSMSAAAPGGGAAASISDFVAHEPSGVCATLNNATFSNRPLFMPFTLPAAIPNVRTVAFALSRTGGTSVAMTCHFGIYSLANSTSLNLISSTSFNVSLTTSAQFSGARGLSWTGLSAMSLSPGQYVAGMLFSGAGTASVGFGLFGRVTVAFNAHILPGTNSTAATASNSQTARFAGVWNATSGALPSAVALSSVSGKDMVNGARVYFRIQAG